MLFCCAFSLFSVQISRSFLLQNTFTDGSFFHGIILRFTKNDRYSFIQDMPGSQVRISGKFILKNRRVQLYPDTISKGARQYLPSRAVCILKRSATSLTHFHFLHIRLLWKKYSKNA